VAVANDVNMDDGGDDAMENETAKHCDEEEMIHASQFSVNVINLFNPPKEINFGKWNTRPLVPLEWKKLKASMTAQGIKSFSTEHMMPLVIKRKYIDMSCVDNKASGYEAKTLELSEEGKQPGVVVKLEMAGGRHRMAALKSIKEDKEKDLAKLKKQHLGLSKRRFTKDDAVAKKMQDLKDYEERMASLKEEISKIGLWGVIVYDEGKRL
jgi:hypothetical protein